MKNKILIILLLVLGFSLFGTSIYLFYRVNQQINAETTSQSATSTANIDTSEETSDQVNTEHFQPIEIPVNNYTEIITMDLLDNWIVEEVKYQDVTPQYYYYFSNLGEESLYSLESIVLFNVSQEARVTITNDWGQHGCGSYFYDTESPLLITTQGEPGGFTYYNLLSQPIIDTIDLGNTNKIDMIFADNQTISSYKTYLSSSDATPLEEKHNEGEDMAFFNDILFLQYNGLNSSGVTKQCGNSFYLEGENIVGPANINELEYSAEYLDAGNPIMTRIEVDFDAENQMKRESVVNLLETIFSTYQRVK